MPLLRRPSKIPQLEPKTDPGLEYMESQSHWSHRRPYSDRRVQDFLREQQRSPSQFPKAKSYPLAERIELTPRWESLELSLFDVLRCRRTSRISSSQPTDLDQVATLLMASFGLQRHLPESSPTQSWQRTVPSPGGLYATEMYYYAIKTKGLPDGLYHFQPEEGCLEALPWEVNLETLRGLYPYREVREHLESAAGVIFLTAVFNRMRAKYGHRYLRFSLLEAGCVCQNLDLVSSALKVGIWHQGSVEEASVRELLKIDGKQEAVVHSALLLGPK